MACSFCAHWCVLTFAYILNPQVHGQPGPFPASLTVTSGDHRGLVGGGEAVYSPVSPGGGASSFWQWQQQLQQAPPQGGHGSPQPSPCHRSPRLQEFLDGGSGPASGAAPPTPPPRCGAPPTAGPALAEHAAADLQAMARSWAANQ